MRQRETPFCFSDFETKQKTGIFTREMGIPLDLYRKIGISGLNRDEWQVCSSSVASYRHFSLIKKNSQLAGLRFFFHERKKNISGIPNKSGGRPSLLCTRISATFYTQMTRSGRQNVNKGLSNQL